VSCDALADNLKRAGRCRERESGMKGFCLIALPANRED